MSTKSANPALVPGSMAETLFGIWRNLFGALAEGKAAADRYEQLVARGVATEQAADTVFREHFGKR